MAGAKEAYRQAANSGHPEHSPVAARNLGHLFKRQGRFRQAVARLPDRPSSPVTRTWPLGRWSISGTCSAATVNPKDARAAYQMAVESGHPEAARQAAKRLADLP